jgi:hypothetical protein
MFNNDNQKVTEKQVTRFMAYVLTISIIHHTYSLSVIGVILLCTA